MFCALNNFLHSCVSDAHLKSDTNNLIYTLTNLLRGRMQVDRKVDFYVIYLSEG